MYARKYAKTTKEKRRTLTVFSVAPVLQVFSWFLCCGNFFSNGTARVLNRRGTKRAKTRTETAGMYSRKGAKTAKKTEDRLLLSGRFLATY
jgi:hypothetical protein